MDRRNFLKATAVTILAAQGHLPLLAAERRVRPARRVDRRASSLVGKNTYTEPAAIEPITGYLPRFKAQARGSMRKAFSAQYQLIACHGSAAKSKNRVAGSLDVTFSESRCKTTEVRQGRQQNLVTTEMTCDGRFNTAFRWTLDSSVQGIPDLSFVEKGVWDGKTMVVRSKSWTQTHQTAHPLIGRWALLPLLSSGILKSKPLRFDMLDDSTLRSDQTLRYSGQSRCLLHVALQNWIATHKPDGALSPHIISWMLRAACN